MATEKQEASQIKSKERVAQRGEVFTAEREVNAMLDLVEHECLRPDSRFLEPACGDGAKAARRQHPTVPLYRKRPHRV